MTASVEYRMVTTWEREEDIKTRLETNRQDKNSLYVRTFEVKGKLWFVSSDITRHFNSLIPINECWSTISDHMMTIHTTTAGRLFEKVVDYYGVCALINFEEDPKRKELLEFVNNIHTNNLINVATPELVRVYMTDEEKKVFI